MRRTGSNEAENARLNRLVPISVRAGNIAKRKRAERGPDNHQADDHPEIANAIDDECLIGRVAGGLSLDVKAD